jgi:hypothetical protein
MGICYVFMPKPGDPTAGPDIPTNINYVYGFDESKSQMWIEDPDVYFTLVMIVLPIGILLPSHLIALWLLPRVGAKDVEPGRS